MAELVLTPLALIDRIAALVPPPRTHRHRYFGVLAPNSPLRAAVTALAAPAQQASAQTGQVGTGDGTPGVMPQGNAGGGGGAQLPQPQPEPVPPKRSPAHYLWAALIARILRPRRASPMPGASGTDRSYAKRASSVLN